MPTTTIHTATEQVDFEHPVWEPLRDHVGEFALNDFMWMYSTVLDDDAHTVVHSYKNCATRRYLHISPDGRFWMYLADADFNSPSRYRELHRPAPFQLCWDAGWEQLLPAQTDPDKVRELISGANLR